MFITTSCSNLYRCTFGRTLLPESIITRIEAVIFASHTFKGNKSGFERLNEYLSACLIMCKIIKFKFNKK